MVGNAIKCDECGKVDVHEMSLGAQYSGTVKWFRITPPQVAAPQTNYEHKDICSLKCLQEYSHGWTSNG